MTLLRAATLALALLLVTAVPGFAADANLREAGDARFPDRAFVLTLPEATDLRPGEVEITEEGRTVENLSVTPAGAGSARALASVLVIDASNSMQGAPIATAMSAARAFAAERRGNQPLGVIFFSRDARVALPLTTDARRIDNLLSRTPVLSKGTQFRDATIAAFELLERAKVSAGSVVLLSDGADAGSTATVESIGTAAQKNRARVYTVGLRSASYDGAALEQVSLATGGSHSTATGAELRRVFAGLGAQLANQYLIRYRSLSPVGSKITVTADVAGLDGVVRTSYETPKLATETFDGTPTTGDASGGSVLLIALILGLLVFAIAWLLLRRPARTVEQRVMDYGLSRPEMRKVARQARPSVQQTRSSGQWWTRFSEDLELAGVRVAPTQVALSVAVVTFACIYVFGFLAGRPAAAVLFTFLPVAFVLYIRSRVERRRREFAEQLADTLQVVASAMRAGQSFSGALAVAVSDADEPMRSELGRVVRDEQLGMTIEKATGEAARRMASAELEQVGLVAALQREAGGNTAEVIDHLTDTIRERDGLRRLVRTLTAQGRTAGIALSLLPVALSAFFAVATPDYFDAMLDSSAGRIMLVAGAALIAAGWVTIRKVVDIKL